MQEFTSHPGKCSVLTSFSEYAFLWLSINVLQHQYLSGELPVGPVMLWTFYPKSTNLKNNHLQLYIYNHQWYILKMLMLIVQIMYGFEEMWEL
jgi:cytochrome oxidase assembly protein ShyY1